MIMPQSIGNISIGRQLIQSLPTEWTLAWIQTIASESLELDDEWEFRRLLELYEGLDERLFQNLISMGLRSENSEIKEASQDFS